MNAQPAFDRFDHVICGKSEVMCGYFLARRLASLRCGAFEMRAPWFATEQTPKVAALGE